MKKLFLLLSVCIASQSHAQNVPFYVPTNGLVGWWPFTGSAIDSSGNGNNGTVYGATLTTDRFGSANRAYYFNGVSNYISVQNNSSISITGDITMSAWVKSFGNNGQNYQTIIGKGDSYWTWEYAMGYSFHNNIPHNGKLLTSRALGMGNQQQAWSSTNYIPNAWELWSVTISNGQAKIYKNGVLDQTTAFTLVPNSLNCPLFFGRYNPNTTSEQFYGNIDDIGIWNRALTSCEITQLYNGGLQNNPSVPLVLFNSGVLSVSGGPYSSYQWMYNGVAIQGATNSTYTPSLNGIYSVVIASGNCNTITTQGYLLSNLGITSMKHSSIEVYPNPSNGIINVESNQDTINCKVYNAIGELIINSNEKQIDLSNKPNGLYYVIVFNNKQEQIGNSKFIKK
jgi:hypothetical protein